MNYLVFNDTASELKTLISGLYNDTTVYDIAVDTDGRLILSPLGGVPVTATDLDIRPLSAATDSVLVSASDLDIRNLSGAQDSVQVYSCNFIEDDVSTNVVSGSNYLMTKEVGPYRQNSFFIRNKSASSSIGVTLQAAPTDSNDYYITIAGPTTVIAGNNNLTSLTPVMKYARLLVTASTTVAVEVYYNARA